MRNNSPRRYEGAQLVPSTTASIIVGSRLRSRRVHLAMVAVGFILFAIYGSWVPLNFRAVEFSVALERFRSIQFLELHNVPLTAMYRGTVFASAGNLAQKILLFLLLGTLLTVLASRLTESPEARRILLVLGYLGCVAVGFLIELGQVLSPQHTPGGTDVILYSSGALLGILVTSR